MGALSSGLFLFGCALLCGAGGSVYLSYIELLFNSKQSFSNVCVPIGYLLIIAALFFKLSAAPFHMWVPDVYEGAPTKTVVLLAVVPKTGIFSLLFSIGLPISLFLIGVVFSLFVGALGALNQTRIKRLLAYSGIGHMGFLLWGLVNGSFESLQASLVYLFIYIIMTICVFSIILSFNVYKNLLIELSGLSRLLPFLSITFGVVFFSIAGIPPFAGFLGKWVVLLSGVLSKSFFIFFFAVFCSVIAGVYYVRIVKIIFFKTAFLTCKLSLFSLPSPMSVGRLDDAENDKNNLKLLSCHIKFHMYTTITSDYQYFSHPVFFSLAHCLHFLQFL